ncbi:hypothetical protein LT679_11970 [Mucilaginibacter roseus]|uniref:Uncharacterized protein n=1 Tax=Mucilaginibacter roseus TaxID=1528868 RepID=A0ABS8U3V8_9SPHI|nr:hypothetical protein [Mucilaginibacter roseus]MCD8741322.1 hypothetical protein [Mucilaginibacter roseus]
MSSSLKYSLKTVGASILLSPVAALLTNGLKDPSSLVFLYFLMVFFGAIAAIPIFILFWPVCHWLNTFVNNNYIKKSILSLLTAVLIAADFYFIHYDLGPDGPEFNDVAAFAVCYILCCCSAIWYYNIKPSLTASEVKPVSQQI